MEAWKPIVGYEGIYEVSSLGNIRSLSRYTRLKSGKERLVNSRNLRLKSVNGYRSVALYKYGTRTEQYVHRLVAYAFIAQPEGKDYVNHIDGNPSNNMVSNLEWVTHSENVQHAYDSGLYSTKGKQREIVENDGSSTARVEKKSENRSITFSIFNNDK